jgi:hypothetical protein
MSPTYLSRMGLFQSLLLGVVSVEELMGSGVRGRSTHGLAIL